MTGIIDRLEAEALVERRPVPGDRRATEVRLTEVGRAHFAELARHHEGWVDRLLGGLGPAETEAAIRLLDRVAPKLEAAR